MNKPRISKAFPGSGGEWWICTDEQTCGFGHTPFEAWWQWYAWKKLGIYA